MARITNDIFKLRGSLGGFSFSQDEKGTIVKQKSDVDKNRIKTDPRSQGTREGNMELGGASRAAKALRIAFLQHSKEFGDRYFSGRLCGVMRKVVGLGEGVPGQRNLDIRKNGCLLENFEFIKSRPLAYSIGGIREKPTLNAERNEVYWTSPSLNRKEQITAPEGATHFQFIMGAAGLCNYNYDPQKNGYLPSLKPPSLARKLHYSEIISLAQKNIAPVSLHLKLSETALPEDMGVVPFVGIEFYRNVNGELMRMEKSLAMRILGVF